jgi:hypothetical protein
MEIAEEVKERYFEMKRMGKIKPVILDIKNRENLKDAYTVIKYKKSII